MNDIEPMGVVPSIIKRILSRLHAPVLIGSHQIRTGASIGVTLYPDSALDKETMLQQADLALYQVKEQGGLQYHLFDKTLKQAAAKQGALEKQIISALNNEDLMLFFQPCYNYQTHKVESMEALLRLRHSEHGVLDPARFLEIAERSGLACQIDMWLLKNVCTQANQWLQEGIDFGRLSFNVCARELCKNGFAQRVCETLDLLEVPGNCIAIEVMERYAIKDFVNYADNISQLRAKGISIMLDDLGTEHSSLQRMLESDVDVVKIDQYFVQHIGEKRAETVIKSLIGLATGMGVRVIAEGVETQEQLGFLLHNGCFSIQGYIHARPMPAIDISAYFKQLPEA